MSGNDGKDPTKVDAEKDSFILVKFDGDTANIVGIGVNKVTVAHFDAASAELKRQADMIWHVQKQREAAMRVQTTGQMPGQPPPGVGVN